MKAWFLFVFLFWMLLIKFKPVQACFFLLEVSLFHFFVTFFKSRAYFSNSCKHWTCLIYGQILSKFENNKIICLKVLRQFFCYVFVRTNTIGFLTAIFISLVLVVYIKDSFSLPVHFRFTSGSLYINVSSSSELDDL